jgi:hypothetical protein
VHGPGFCHPKDSFDRTLNTDGDVFADRVGGFFALQEFRFVGFEVDTFHTLKAFTFYNVTMVAKMKVNCCLFIRLVPITPDMQTSCYFGSSFFSFLFAR